MFALVQQLSGGGGGGWGGGLGGGGSIIKTVWTAVHHLRWQAVIASRSTAAATVIFF